LILALMITPAAVQDRDAARPLIKALVSMYARRQIIWADGGYRGALVNWVKQLRPFGKLRLEIVRRCDDVKGFKVLPRRWVVERTFGWWSKSRRLCRDYEVRLDHRGASCNHHRSRDWPEVVPVEVTAGIIQRAQGA
jgi:transposase